MLLQICSFIEGMNKRWIDDQYVPYAFKGKEWVGYDDAISFSYMVRTWFFIDPTLFPSGFYEALVCTMCVCMCVCGCTHVHMHVCAYKTDRLTC